MANLHHPDSSFWIIVTRDAIGGAIAATSGITLWLRKRSASNWPMTDGNIESVYSAEDNTKWRTNISYSYRVGTDFYSGAFQLTSSNERKADDTKLQWKDRHITVRYSPRDPQISVVRHQDQAGLQNVPFQGH
jgi:Protein of unknown function (DUF3592)